MPEAPPGDKKTDRAGNGAMPVRMEQLEYIRQLLLELRAMAAGANAPMLAYLLEMSVIEAAQVQENHKAQTSGK